MPNFKPLICPNDNPRAQAAAAEFPEKLYAVHGSSISIRETAVYEHCESKIDVHCNTCGHDWSARADCLVGRGQGCPSCAKARATEFHKARARKNAEGYEARLLRSHGGSIRLQPGYSYTKSHDVVGFHCKICGNEWAARAWNVGSGQSGCPQCAVQSSRIGAGQVRARRADEATKDQARRMYASGLTIAHICRELGWSRHAVTCWVRPGYQQVHYQKQLLTPGRLSGRAKQIAKQYQTETPNGRASRKNASHRRRRLELGIREIEDNGQWITTIEPPRSEEDQLLYARLCARQDYLNNRDGAGTWHIEHLLPLAQGGSNDVWNLAIRHRDHNLSKGPRIHEGDMDTRRKNITCLFAPRGCTHHHPVTP